MKQTTECICKISKAGKNLFARVPDDVRDEINYGDKVKIVVIEKAVIKDPTKITSALKAFLKNPTKEMLKGTIMGFPVKIDVGDIIKNMPKAEKLFFDAIMGK